VRGAFGEAPADAPEPLDHRLIRLLGRAELVVTLAAFAGVVALVSVQVALRFLFAYGLVWAQEVAQLLILVAYFLGTSYVYKARHYLLIGIVFDRLPERLRILLYLAAQALTAVFCLMLFVELCGLAPAQLRMKTYILQVPRFYSSLPLLIGSASMDLTAIYYGARTGLAARTWGGRTLGEIEAGLNPFRAHRMGCTS
jgi:TRAP-type C4-dicarboxylate transport system permease small subunit